MLINTETDFDSVLFVNVISSSISTFSCPVRRSSGNPKWNKAHLDSVLEITRVNFDEWMVLISGLLSLQGHVWKEISPCSGLID